MTRSKFPEIYGAFIEVFLSDFRNFQTSCSVVNSKDLKISFAENQENSLKYTTK